MTARNRNGGEPLEGGNRQDPYGGGSKAARPPRPLDPRLPPSRRHPEGLFRCQRWDIDDGEQWQCSKAARRGFRVCGVHGAGYPAREKRGQAVNPKLGHLVNAHEAKPETVAALLASRPHLQALFKHEIQSDELFDLRPQLAMAKVLARYFVEQATLEDTDNSFGKMPPALAAIDALNRVMQIAERFLSIEDKLGPITHEELRQYVQAVAHTMVRFIPAERHGEAFDYLRAEALRANAAPETEAGPGSHNGAS